MAHETTDAGIGPALGDAGPCPKITHADKTWVLGHPTQRAKAELEFLVVEAAQKNIDDLKPILKPADYRRRCAALDELVNGGHYKTGGSLWTVNNNGPLGQPLFLGALLRERNPEVTLAEAVAIWLGEPDQTRRALGMVVPDFFAVLATSLPLSPDDRSKWQAEMTAEFLAGILQPVASTVSDSSAPTPP